MQRIKQKQSIKHFIHNYIVHTCLFVIIKYMPDERHNSESEIRNPKSEIRNPIWNPNYRIRNSESGIRIWDLRLWPN